MALLSGRGKGGFYGSTLGDDVTVTTVNKAPDPPSWKDLTKKRQITSRITDPLSALSWDKLSLRLLLDDGSYKSLLHEVSGVLLQGELVAILGPSGAGKTTLLDALFGTLPKNALLTGTIRKWPVDRELVQEIRPDLVLAGTEGTSVAYIPQHDLFYETLTLHEHLSFQVELRKGTNDEKLVEDVMSQLSLEHAANNLISNLSGGERRRVSVATELLSEPTFLLCDEITTGLDMFQALQLVKCLRGLSRTGVLCTIHQPPTQVFSLFTRSMFLVSGSLKSEGTQEHILEQFEGLGYPCPSTNNPADFVIRVLSAGSTSERTYREFLNNVEQMYRQSKSRYISDFLIEVHGKTMNRDLSGLGSSTKLTYRQEWWLLLRRTATYTARDKVYRRVRVFQVVFISLILGLLYFNTPSQNVQNIMGSLFFLLINLSFSAIFATLQTFPNELPVFRREYKNGVARIGPYFLAKTLAELPFYLIYPSIYIVIAYFLVGYTATAEKFFTFWIVMLLVYHTSLSVGYLISSLASSPQTANAVGLPVGVIFFLFAGYFITVPTIPKLLRWLVYLSYMFFGYQGIMTNEFKGVVFENNCTGKCSKWSSGDQVLEVYGFSGAHTLLIDTLVLLFLLLGFRLAGYIALSLSTKKR